MRNGLNISGLSEYVNEIKTHPEEAVIRFATLAELNRGLVEVETRTASLGTIRMARGFRTRVDPAGAVVDYITPEEASVAALGACVLITHVQGFSVRGVNLTTLTVNVEADVEVDESGRWVGGEQSLRNLRYRVNVVGDAPVDQTRAISQFTTCFSPNHRVFLDAADFVVGAAVRRSDGSTEQIEIGWDEVVGQPAASGGRTMAVSADLRWDYGTETHITTAVEPDPRRRYTPAVIADQPKQMSGFDKGSNPQELLLTAVSADLAYGVQRAASGAGVPVTRVEVDCYGQLDIRGMQNVSKEVPARFHGLRFRADIESDAPADQVRAAVLDAVRSSVPLAALRRANEIAVESYHDGEEAIRFRSDADQVKAFLQMLADQEAAQKLAVSDAAKAAATTGAGTVEDESEAAELSVAGH